MSNTDDQGSVIEHTRTYFHWVKKFNQEKDPQKRDEIRKGTLAALAISSSSPAIRQRLQGYVAEKAA